MVKKGGKLITPPPRQFGKSSLHEMQGGKPTR